MKKQFQVGQVVGYRRFDDTDELGMIRSWNDKFIFVVYGSCIIDDPENAWNYTAAATDPKDLVDYSYYILSDAAQKAAEGMRRKAEEEGRDLSIELNSNAWDEQAPWFSEAISSPLFA